jgi:hypothetical protein
VATKIICKSCQAHNDLGRMFCSGCGQRLDFSPGSLSGSGGGGDVAGKARRALVVVAVFGLLAVVALALWTPVVPAAAGLESGVRSVPQKFKGLQIAVQGKRSASASFTEQELNGFLAAKARELKLARLQVDLRPGEFEVVAVKRFVDKPATAGEPEKAPLPFGLAWSLSGTMESGKPKARSARLGHLPLPGPLAGAALEWFRRLADRAAPDAASFRPAVKSVQLEADRAVVSVGG